MVMAGWGALAPMSGAVVATGALQVEGGRQAVQHPYGGVVAELLVAEGDTVTSGQILLRLSDAEPRAQVEVLSAERDTLMAAQGRLIAERDGLETPAFADDLLARAETVDAQQAMASETQLMAARTEQYQTSLNIVTQQKAQLAERLASAQAQIDGLQRRRESTVSELTDAQTLLDQQLIARNRVLELERSVSDIDAQIAVQQSDLASASKAVAEADLEIAGLARDRVADANEELRANQAALASLAPQLGAAQDALNRTEIVATANGTVVGLTALTEGGVVAAGQELLGIVPSDSPLMVEAQMRLADVTEVARGTVADIRLLALPATGRPPLTGTVETISADRIVDERTGQAYYALQIALDAEQAAATGFDLQAGMPVQVVIPTKGRTMMDYLVSPLLDEISGAFREK